MSTAKYILSLMNPLRPVKEVFKSVNSLKNTVADAGSRIQELHETSARQREELKNRGFLEARGKQIISTELGRSLISILPESVKSAGMTALFEKVLKQVQSGDTPLDTFVSAQAQFVKQQVATANAAAITIEGVVASAKKASTKRSGAKQRRKTA